MAVIAIGLWLYFVRRGFIGGPKLRDLAPARSQGGRPRPGLGRGSSIRVTSSVFNSDDSSP